MKTTKGGKVMNPTDAYRKELRKKELKRNKKERKKVREVGILKKDPEAIKDQIRKLESMKADGALDKTRRHKKRQLEDTLNLVLKKRKEYEEKMREKGEDPVMFSHLPPPRRRAPGEELKGKEMRPEDSVYFHPTMNPTGAPPPGKPPMYKSSIGSSTPGEEPSAADDLNGEGTSSSVAIPIPPPPPLPMAGEGTSSSVEDATVISLPVPVPPPPPAPPRPAAPAIPIPPPPPPGPPPKARSQVLPPPPPFPRQSQPPPPGTGVMDTGGSVKPPGTDGSGEKIGGTDSGLQDWNTNKHGTLPQTSNQESRLEQKHEETSQIQNSVSSLPLPPPPPAPPVMMRPIQGGMEVLPPGIQRLPPPPPPPAMRPPSISGSSFAPPRLLPTGAPMGAPSLTRPPPPPLGAPPPPPPPLVRTPLVPAGMPPMSVPPRAQDVNPLDDVGRSFKPSFVKFAAPTVVKRPLAQHTPELTSMVPASVLVRRESAQKAKPKPVTSVSTAVNIRRAPTSHPTSKPQSIDDSYSAFLEDMKALGAFEGDIV